MPFDIKTSSTEALSGQYATIYAEYAAAFQRSIGTKIQQDMFEALVAQVNDVKQELNTRDIKEGRPAGETAKEIEASVEKRVQEKIRRYDEGRQFYMR